MGGGQATATQGLLAAAKATPGARLRRYGSPAHSGGRPSVLTVGGVKSTKTSISSVCSGRDRAGGTQQSGRLKREAGHPHESAGGEPEQPARVPAQERMAAAQQQQQQHLEGQPGLVRGAQRHPVPPLLQPAVLLWAGAQLPVRLLLRIVALVGDRRRAAVRQGERAEAAGDVVDARPVGRWRGGGSTQFPLGRQCQLLQALGKGTPGRRHTGTRCVLTQSQWR